MVLAIAGSLASGCGAERSTVNEQEAGRRVLDEMNQMLALFQQPKPRLVSTHVYGEKLERMPCSDVGSKPNGMVSLSQDYELHDLDLDPAKSLDYFAKVRALWNSRGFSVTDEELPTVENKNYGSIGAKKPDGFGVRIYSNEKFISLISASPCVWPKGHPE